jgi:hypothetical protein
MTTIHAYRRAVREYLRDGYAASNFHEQHGGSHTKLLFTMNGKHCSILLNDRNGAGASSAPEMKFQDIRRLFGDPAPRPEKERRTLAQMTAALKPLAPLITNDGAAPITITVDGHAALYAAPNGGLAFGLPEAAVEHLGGHGSPVGVTTLAMYKWRIYAVLAHGKNVPTISPRGLIRTSAAPAGCPDLTPFGKTRAIIVLGAGRSVEIRVDPVDLHPVIARRKRGSDIKVDVVAEPSPAPVVEPPATSPRWREDPRREALRLIREVESTTDYRLVRTKTDDGARRWVFRAPDVALDEEGAER